MSALAELIQEQAERRKSNRKFLDDHARTVRGLTVATPDDPKVTLQVNENEDVKRPETPQQPAPNPYVIPQQTTQDQKKDTGLLKTALPYLLPAVAALGGVAGTAYYMQPKDDKPNANTVIEAPESEGSFIDGSSVQSGQKRSLLQVIEDEGFHITD